MKTIRSSRLMIFVCVILSGLNAGIGAAEDLDIVNRPVNTSGLTGILFTTAPYTVPKGTLEIGFSIVSESSVTPDYTILEYPLSITIGLSESSEIALRGSYYNIKEGPTVTAPIDRKAGNLELSYKWNFLPSMEGSFQPAIALLVSGFVPQESNSDRRINTVSHWGVRLGIAAGTELTWREHMLAVYADGQMAGQDVTEKRLRDTYAILNAGMLFPISKYRNLQMLFEYSRVQGKDTVTIEGGDYSAMTYGLRMVSERFNLTMGTQFIRKRTEGFENSNRVVGHISTKF
jgi:hypothetical protein